MLRASVYHNKQVDTSFSYNEHLPPKPGKNLNVLSDLSCMIIILKVLMFQTTATDRYCQYCDRGYKSVKSLRAHMRHAHFLAQEPYCDRCLALSHLFFDGHAPGKWYHRSSILLSEPNRWSGFLFDRSHYERFIRRKKVWAKLPQLYGKVIGCWCELECHCQVSVLKRLVQEKMKEDFPHVKEEDVAELKQCYKLKDSERNLIKMSLECLKAKAKINQERNYLEPWRRCVDPTAKIRELQSHLTDE